MKKMPKVKLPKKSMITYGQEAAKRDSIAFVIGLFLIYIGTLLVGLGFRIEGLNKTVK